MGLGLCMKWSGVAEFFDPTKIFGMLKFSESILEITQ